MPTAEALSVVAKANDLIAKRRPFILVCLIREHPKKGSGDQSTRAESMLRTTGLFFGRMGWNVYLAVGEHSVGEIRASLENLLDIWTAVVMSVTLPVASVEGLLRVMDEKSRELAKSSPGKFIEITQTL